MNNRDSNMKKIAFVSMLLIIVCFTYIALASSDITTTQNSLIVVNKDMTRDEVANLIQTEINKETENKLTFLHQFVPNDKSSGHYRTEFRLGAYRDASGYAYMYGNAQFDIIIRDQLLKNNTVRIYVENATLDDCCDIIRIASPLLDEKLTEQVLSETIDYIYSKGTANGYYYSKLGLTLFGSEENGYSLMIKMD